VSQTVQVLAYAAAPAALAGVPAAPLRLAAAAYGSGLLVVGLATVHRTSIGRAALAAALHAALVFGYGFGGFAGGAETVAGVAGWFETVNVDIDLEAAAGLAAGPVVPFR